MLAAVYEIFLGNSAADLNEEKRVRMIAFSAIVVLRAGHELFQVY